MPSNWNMFCPYCLTATKQNFRCGKCGQLTLKIGKHARVPKKHAKKKEWQNFFRIFPYILSICPRSKSLKNLGIQK